MSATSSESKSPYAPPARPLGVDAPVGPEVARSSRASIERRQSLSGICRLALTEANPGATGASSMVEPSGYAKCLYLRVGPHPACPCSCFGPAMTCAEDIFLASSSPGRLWRRHLTNCKPRVPDNCPPAAPAPISTMRASMPPLGPRSPASKLSRVPRECLRYDSDRQPARGPTGQRYRLPAERSHAA